MPKEETGARDTKRENIGIFLKTAFKLKQAVHQLIKSLIP